MRGGWRATFRAVKLARLMYRIERAGRTMGRADAPHEAIAWTLALPPERYARVRASAQRARRGGFRSVVRVAAAPSTGPPRQSRSGPGPGRGRPAEGAAEAGAGTGEPRAA